MSGGFQVPGFQSEGYQSSFANTLSYLDIRPPGGSGSGSGSGGFQDPGFQGEGWQSGTIQSLYYRNIHTQDIPTPPEPPTGPPQSGVRGPSRGGKRRWALRYHGKLYYFEDLRALEAFANQPPAEAMRAGRKDKPKLVVPLETIREAKAAGYDGLQKLAERMELDALKRLEALIYQDEEDFRDFMDFTDFVKWMTQ